MRLKFWVEFVPMTCLRAKFVLLHGWALSRAQNFARGPYKWTFPLRVTATEMQANQYLNQLVTRSRILCIPVLVSVTSLPLCLLGGSDMSMSLQRDDPWSLSIATFPCKTTERRRGKLRQTENGSSFQGVKGKELPIKFTVGALGKSRRGNSALLPNLLH